MPARPDRVRLTPEQERIAREQLAAGATASCAAIAAGISYQRLKWAIYQTGQLADVRVGQGKRSGVRPSVQNCDVTEAEIEAAKRAIRVAKGDLPPPPDFSDTRPGSH